MIHIGASTLDENIAGGIDMSMTAVRFVNIKVLQHLHSTLSIKATETSYKHQLRGLDKAAGILFSTYEAIYVADMYIYLLMTLSVTRVSDKCGHMVRKTRNIIRTKSHHH